VGGDDGKNGGWCCGLAQSEVRWGKIICALVLALLPGVHLCTSMLILGQRLGQLTEGQQPT
jgi:hypothetical protein